MFVVRRTVPGLSIPRGHRRCETVGVQLIRLGLWLVRSSTGTIALSVKYRTAVTGALQLATVIQDIKAGEFCLGRMKR